MNEKKSYFVPIEKPCDYADKCTDFSEKCEECKLNKNLKRIKEPVQEKRTLKGLEENMTEKYKTMPKEFKLF